MESGPNQRTGLGLLGNPAFEKLTANRSSRAESQMLNLSLPTTLPKDPEIVGIKYHKSETISNS